MTKTTPEQSEAGLGAALDRLYRRRQFGIKLGLHVEEALLDRLGRPDRGGRFVHVAGTNGKGSVCAIVSAVLQSAGYRTGLYTSPHLVRFNERFQVNGESISDSDLLALVRAVDAISPEVARDTGQEPTFFECATAMGFEHFKRCGVELAVIETGLGGRLDATNVITPLVSVITRIGIEHTEYLGKDLASITAEKAGIIKPGVPVVAGLMEEESLAVIRRVCAERGCALIEAGAHASIRVKESGLAGQKVHVETRSASYGTVKFPLPGTHQIENLATAVTVIDVLRDAAGVDIDEKQVKTGIAVTQWPGRFQVLKPDPPMILDGAHNPDGASALAGALRTVLGDRPLGLVMGMCGDKDVRRFLGHFSGQVRRLWVVGIRDERNMPADDILAAARELGLAGETASLPDALRQAEAWAAVEHGAVCVTGSLFLVGEVLENKR